jgi:hypothetical protein
MIKQQQTTTLAAPPSAGLGRGVERIFNMYLIFAWLDTTQQRHRPVVHLLWPLAFFSVVLCQLRRFTTRL